VAGGRLFDFNNDGLAHVGLLPDMLADLESLEIPPGALEPMFNSAEGYVRMWELAEARSHALRPISNVADTLNGVFRVHYAGQDAHIHEMYISGGWQEGDLTAVVGGVSVAANSPVVSVVDSINRVLRVHYIGVDRHIHELSLSGGRWRYGDLTAATGGPLVAPGSPLKSIADTINGVFRVHYVGADAHIHEMYISGGWRDGDLTAVAGGPAVAAGSGLSSVADRINEVFRVHYTGVDSHIHELSISGGWRDGDLTAATRGPSVAAGSVIASVADTINGVLRVHYLGVDRRIHELSISGGWRDADLSGVTGGPEVMAGSGLASVVDSVNGVFRLHYIAADAHVHELYISGGWHDGDLTGVGGGPTVAPGTAIASVADTINHVFRIHYAGKDDRVHELSISGGWRDGDLTGATGGAPVGAAIR
jgi:hypothetical protein